MPDGKRAFIGAKAPCGSVRKQGPCGGVAFDDPPSEVTYLLVADGDGTRLTVQERPLQVGTVARAAGRADWTDWDNRLARGWVRLERPLAIAGGARY